MLVGCWHLRVCAKHSVRHCRQAVLCTARLLCQLHNGHKRQKTHAGEAKNRSVFECHLFILHSSPATTGGYLPRASQQLNGTFFLSLFDLMDLMWDLARKVCARNEARALAFFLVPLSSFCVSFNSKTKYCRCSKTNWLCGIGKVSVLGLAIYSDGVAMYWRSKQLTCIFFAVIHVAFSTSRIDARNAWNARY